MFLMPKVFWLADFSIGLQIPKGFFPDQVFKSSYFGTLITIKNTALSDVSESVLFLSEAFTLIFIDEYRILRGFL
jgi:hypothetical protein